MIDDEGTHRARRADGLGPVDQPRGGSRRRARRTPAARSESRSSTTAATASGGDGRPVNLQQVCGVAALLALRALAAEQETGGGFDRLAGLVGPGDAVRVTFRGGLDRVAQSIEVTPTKLSVLDRDVRRDLGETDVWMVHHRLEDSNANGAGLGFAAGAAYGIYTAMPFWESPPEDTGEVIGGLTVLGGFYGAAGAWAGYAVDRMIRREGRSTAAAPDLA